MADDDEVDNQLSAEQPDEEAESSTANEDDAPGVDAQTGENTADDEESTDEKPKPKRMGGFQKRIHGLTERLQRQQQEIEALRAAQSAPPTLDEPKRDDFDDYEEFLEARAAFVAEKRFATLEQQRQQSEQRRLEQQQAQTREMGWQDGVQAARDKYDDFDDVAFGEVHITEPMADAMKDSELGAEIAYWLGKNPSDAAKIARKSPLAQLREIGRIEERLTTRPPKPPPPTPVRRGRTSAATSSTQLSDDLPMDQWQKLRNKQVGRT